MTSSRCSLVRRSAFLTLGAAIALAAAAAPAGAQTAPTTTANTTATDLAPDRPAPTTTTTAAPTDHRRDRHDHDGHPRDGRDRHRDRRADDRRGDEHHDGEHVAPTTTAAGRPPRQDRAVRAQPAHTAPAGATTGAGREAFVHRAGAAAASPRSTPTSTTRPQPTTVPSTAAARLDAVKTVSAQGINASLRHNQSTSLEGELVSRRVTSPLTAGFVALAILVLLLDGGRRRTRRSR
jgi:hypothetical protein